MALKEIDLKHIKFNGNVAEAQAYLNEIKKYKPLTREQEKQLGYRIREGDRRALDKLVKANLRFVRVVANAYCGRGIEFNDLIQYGNIGLYEAAKLFDPDKGYKFISFAVAHIKKYIYDGIYRHSRIIRLPGNAIKTAKTIESFKEHFHNINGRFPETQEILQCPEINMDRINEYFKHGHISHSVDDLINDKGAETFSDFLGANDKMIYDFLEKQHVCQQVYNILSKLNPKHRKIICMHFGIGYDSPKGDHTIGQEMNYTKERIRQIRTEIIKKIRQSTTITP